MKKYLIAFFVLITANSLAQQEGLFTQYMYNPASLNTAYTGSRGEKIVYVQYRNQWNNFPGSPEALYFNYQNSGANKLSYGLSISQQTTGPMNQSAIGIDFAYSINTSEKGHLSFGIKPMVDLLDVRITDLNIYNPQDPWFSVNIRFKSVVFPDPKKPVITVTGIGASGSTWLTGFSNPLLIMVII